MNEPSPTATLRPSKAHVLCAYAEPLVGGRRVLVVGDASLDLGSHLTEAGARVVHVYDPDAARARAARASRGVTVRPLPDLTREDFDVRDGAFDLAIVQEISEIGDAAALLGRLRRIVGGEGAVLVAAQNPDAPEHEGSANAVEYHELYDLVALQFASVRMIAQVPFVGVTLAELGDVGEPEVSVDTQLVREAATPEVFVALGSQRDVRLGAYSIVQLPAAPAASAKVSAAHIAADVAMRASLAEAQLRADLLATQLEEQRALAVRATAAARQEEDQRAKKSDDSALAKLKESETRAGEHYARAERLAHDTRKLEEELGRERDRGTRLSKELEDEKKSRARVEVAHDTRKLEEELDRERDRGTRLSKELEDEKKSRARVEVDLGIARKNPELGASRDRAAMLELAVQKAEQSAASHEARAHDAERGIALRDQQLAVLAAEFEAVRAAIDVPSVDPEAVRRLAERADSADAAVAVLEMDLANIGEVHTEELIALETQLQERAGVIQALELEIARRERLVRELIMRVEEGQQAAPIAHVGSHAPPDQEAIAAAARENSELREKLDKLALHVARREGDLQSQAWKIAELESKAALPPPAPHASGNGEAEKQLANAHAELDALRQALTQEHAVRGRIESGDELTKARAELSRQAVLIEQLSRELEARDRSRVAPAQG